jgi:hypothetical protein
MNAIRGNWAKVEPEQVAALVARKPDRFDLANLEFAQKYGTPAEVAALTKKLTGVPA